jgi:hypothetical protein
MEIIIAVAPVAYLVWDRYFRIFPLSYFGIENVPRFINTDKAPTYGRALAQLKREGRCPPDVEHRQGDRGNACLTQSPGFCILLWRSSGRDASGKQSF